MRLPFYDYIVGSAAQRAAHRRIGVFLLASACCSAISAGAYAQGFDIHEGEEWSQEAPSMPPATRGSTYPEPVASPLKLPLYDSGSPAPQPLASPPASTPPVLGVRSAGAVSASSPSAPQAAVTAAATPIPTAPGYLAPPSALSLPARPLYPDRAPTPSLPPVISPTAPSPAARVPVMSQTGTLPAPSLIAGDTPPASPPPSPLALSSAQAAAPAKATTLPSLPPPPPAAGQPSPKSVSVSPPPAVLGSSNVAATAGHGLSVESKQILSYLKPGSSSSTAPARPGKVDMKRVDPEVADIVKKAEQFYESAGVSISVRQSTDATSELGQAYDALMGGETGVAIRIYQDILRRDPVNEEALFGLAATYHRTGQLDNARPLYGRLLKQNPSHKEALNNFLMLVSAEAPQEALNELSNLEQRNPTFSPIPAQMAILYDRLGQPEVAQSKMMRAIELAPENWVYKYNLAIMLDRRGQYADAASIYKELINAGLQGEKLPMDMNALQARYNYISAKTA